MYRMYFASAEKGDYLLEIQLQSMKSEWQETVYAPWADWLPQTQCKTLAGFGDSLEHALISIHPYHLGKLKKILHGLGFISTHSLSSTQERVHV